MCSACNILACMSYIFFIPIIWKWLWLRGNHGYYTKKCPNKQQTRNEKNPTNNRKTCWAIFWIGMKCLIDILFMIMMCLMYKVQNRKLFILCTQWMGRRARVNHWRRKRGRSWQRNGSSQHRAGVTDKNSNNVRNLEENQPNIVESFWKAK